MRLSSALRVLLFATLPALSAGCGDDALAPDGPELAPYFRIEGHAAGAVGTLDITCRFEWLFEPAGDPTPLPEAVVRVPVRWGGDARRTVLLPDGSGISLWPDLFSPDSYALLLPDDSIEIVSPASVGDATPFYRELGVLAGSLREDGTATGTWRCAPFNTRGDDTGTVEGDWVLTPVPAP